MATLQVGRLFEKGWTAFKANLGLAILVFIIQGIISNLSFLGQTLDSPGLEMLLNLVIFIISGPLLAGVMMVYVKIVRGEQAEVGDMFAGFTRFGKGVGVFLLVGLGVLAGFMLLIIPGIILALGLFPAMYLVMDEELGVVDTLKRAWEMMRGSKGSLLILTLALLGLNVLGLLALGIGLFVTAPLSNLIGAAAYDELYGGAQAQLATPGSRPIG